MFRFHAVCLVAVALATGGCGGSQAGHEVRAKEVSHVRAMTALYAKAASVLGRNPKDEQELKEVVGKSDVRLSAYKVDSIDELFTSDRDGKPLVILYGPAANAASGVVVHEQEGVDGKRLVGFKIGQIEEADAARLAELVPAAGK